MIGLGAAFGGGAYVRHQLDKVTLPKLSRRRDWDKSESFRLTVKVVSASAPAISSPGLLSRQRPRLEISLGAVKKKTELGDFQRVPKGTGKMASGGGVCAEECPWRFGDTLTFVAHLSDVLGHGLVLRLRAESDYFLGPLEFQGAGGPSEVGETAVDLKRFVLPACVGGECCKTHSHSPDIVLWETPVLVVPLSHVRGAIRKDGLGIGEPVGHVAFVFCVDADPEQILEASSHVNRPATIVVEDGVNRMEQNVNRIIQWLDTPVEDLVRRRGKDEGESKGRTAEGNDVAVGGVTVSRNAQKQCLEREGASPLAPPDLDPLGWVSRRGPSGQISWHHTSLGPAPWSHDEVPSKAKGRCAIASPEIEPAGWMCSPGPNGRTFWHHKTLGPAPWEAFSGRVAKAW
jgi:hypothetical protein